MRIETNTMSAGLMKYGNPAGTWAKIIVRIFGIDPAFDGMH